MDVFIHLFNEYVLYTYYVPYADKINKTWVLQDLYSIMTRQATEQLFSSNEYVVRICCEPGTILICTIPFIII